MCRKILILSILIVIALLLLGGWFVFRQYERVSEGENLPKGTETLSENPENTTQPVSEIDTSNWKTYRSEKYGFEFKLSDEYSIPENLRNQDKETDGIVYLDLRKNEYVFNSRKGMGIVREVAGRGDASDYWAIRLKIHPYSKLAETEFEKWIRKNDTSAIHKIGTKTLDSGRVINFVSRYSIGGNSSAFFIEEKHIIEFETSEDTYFLNDEKNYFSAILNSIQP